MLVVRNYLDKSKIHGIGLFADEDIQPGRIIWQPGFELLYTVEEFEAFPEDVREFIRVWGWLDRQDNLHHFPLDNDRFMNHSERSNTAMWTDGTLRATLNIARGEEILCDYREFEKEFRFAEK